MTTNDSSTLANLDECIDFLLKEDLCGPKAQIKVETEIAVKRIEDFTHDDGLGQDQLLNLIKLATNGKYGDNVSSRLVKSLLPQGSVPSSAIVIIASKVCTNKLSLNMKVLLLQWILMVFDLIDDLKDVHSMYGIFFNFLDSIMLCPHICHLLYYLTRKEDVLHYRVEKILALQSRMGIKPHLVGLLSIYNTLCPSLGILITSASNKKSWFKKLDRSWRERIKKVQNKYSAQVSVDSFILSKMIVHKSSLSRKRKLGHRINIPAIRSPSLTERISSEQLSSFKDLLDNIDNIEFPSQVACVLDSPLLQHVVSCNPDFTVQQRLKFWLNHSLCEEFMTGLAFQTDTSSVLLLQKLKHFSCFLQESIPALESFLVRYLFTWNGLNFRPLLLELIAQLSLWPFQRFNDLILVHLRKLFFSSSVYVKCQVMYCFTGLLRNFLTIELPRQQELIQEERSSNKWHQEDVSMFVKDEMASFDPQKTLYDFIQFVDKICVLGLQIEKDHALLQHWVLNFFELVSIAHRQFSLPFVEIPSSGIIYRMLFSDNSMAVSRLCQIIVNYKREFESLKTSQGESQVNCLTFPDGFQSIQRLNQYILDICDSLWRNKAFIDRDKSFCFSMPSAVIDSLAVNHMNELFSIHHHASLIGEAWRFLHQTQPEGMKLTPSLIKGRSRRAFLEYLKLRNLHGILTFLDTFIRPRS